MAKERRKSKTSGSATASANGDDSSQVSKSSKKSLFGKMLSGRKKSKAKKDIAPNTTDTSLINDSVEPVRLTEPQKTFLRAQESKKSYMLKIALLLVDAKTRRFELLQLEFDSDKALVSDALSQIPIHVTEKVLSSQTYTGVCGADSVERKRSVALFDFCKGCDVLVAIPSGTSSEECARLAKPILSDEKVIGMLSTSGINADPWITAPIAAPRPPFRSRNTDIKVREPPRETSETRTTIFYALLVVFVTAACLFFFYRSQPAVTMTESGEPTSQAWSTPTLNLEPLWSGCNNFCDASRGFVEKYIVSPPQKQG